MPLDALKKGSIVDWKCDYTLDKAEVPPLIDALLKNTSLTKLNLAAAGLEWTIADGSATPLIEGLAKNPASLSGIKELTISTASNFELPVGELRAGGDRASAALEKMHFFARGTTKGPWHTDMVVMGDLLRTSSHKNPMTDAEQEVCLQDLLLACRPGPNWPRPIFARAAAPRLSYPLPLPFAPLSRRCLFYPPRISPHLPTSRLGSPRLLSPHLTSPRLASPRLASLQVGDVVLTLLEEAHAGDMTKKIWEQRVKLLLLGGDLRRAYLETLIGAECLRDVGYTADDLIATGFTLAELKRGRFLVAELRASGVSVSDLSATRYSAREMREGGVTASELKPLGYDPHTMREGGYTASEVRAARYALPDLKGVYTAAELLTAEYPAAEMRRVGYEVSRGPPPTGLQPRTCRPLHVILHP